MILLLSFYHIIKPKSWESLEYCLNYASVLMQGVVGTNITIKVLCSVMADSSLRDPYARYAAVARLMMDTFSLKCLDASYSSYLRDMTNTSWEGPNAGGGGCANVGLGGCVLVILVGCIQKFNPKRLHRGCGIFFSCQGTTYTAKICLARLKAP